MTTTQPANDNRAPATAGGIYYPEMNERQDGKALFTIRVGYGGYSVGWSPARHAEALAAFKALRIRPRSMDEFTTLKGARKCSACVTWDAGHKLAGSPYAVLEALLD
jgi:hypothetical protein